LRFHTVWRLVRLMLIDFVGSILFG
jgi:hypothetical protein